MKVFLSWSGDRSRQVADALRTWLPRVIQTIKPWMSDADISAGSRWLAEVSSVLDETSIGIVCVTQENLTSPWLHFEAGALSKALDQSRICPLALGLTPGQVSGPLSQFQTVTLDSAGVLKILNSLNKLSGEHQLPVHELEEIFGVWWPHLETRISAIPILASPPPTRSTSDQIEELLQISREQLRRENLRLEASKSKDEKVDEMIELMDRQRRAVEPLQNSLMKMISTAGDAMKRGDIHTLEIGNDEGEKDLVQNFGEMLRHAGAFPISAQALAAMSETTRRAQEQSRALTENLLSQPAAPGAPGA